MIWSSSALETEELTGGSGGTIQKVVTFCPVVGEYCEPMPWVSTLLSCTVRFSAFFTSEKNAFDGSASDRNGVGRRRVVHLRRWMPLESVQKAKNAKGE